MRFDRFYFKVANRCCYLQMSSTLSECSVYVYFHEQPVFETVSLVQSLSRPLEVSVGSESPVPGCCRTREAGHSKQMEGIPFGTLKASLRVDFVRGEGFHHYHHAR